MKLGKPNPKGILAGIRYGIGFGIIGDVVCVGRNNISIGFCIGLGPFVGISGPPGYDDQGIGPLL
jgi:hypothetical protein